jgi:hypothetical protein
VGAGHGASHGNWWNGTVWAECRARAADYFREIGPLLPPGAEAVALADDYAAIAALLEQCASKELEANAKVKLLAEAAELEGACIARIEQASAAME